MAPLNLPFVGYLLFPLLLTPTASEPIQSACDCTVTGVINDVTLTANGYLFAGAGAHTGYSSPDGILGYPFKWCYAKDAAACDQDFEFSQKNTLDAWKAAGASWRKATGDLVLGGRENRSLPPSATVMTSKVLDFPLGWPDCAELCRNTTQCSLWGFNPSSGECSLTSSTTEPADTPEFGQLIVGGVGISDDPWHCPNGRTAGDLCVEGENWALYGGLLGFTMALFPLVLLSVIGQYDSTDVMTVPARAENPTWSTTMRTYHTSDYKSGYSRSHSHRVDVVAVDVLWTQPGCGAVGKRRVSSYMTRRLKVQIDDHDGECQVKVRSLGTEESLRMLKKTIPEITLPEEEDEADCIDSCFAPVFHKFWKVVVWILFFGAFALWMAALMIRRILQSAPDPNARVYDELYDSYAMFAMLVPIFLVNAVTAAYPLWIWDKISPMWEDKAPVEILPFYKLSFDIAAAVVDENGSVIPSLVRRAHKHERAAVLSQALITCQAHNKGRDMLKVLMKAGADPSIPFTPHSNHDPVTPEVLFPDTDWGKRKSGSLRVPAPPEAPAPPKVSPRRGSRRSRHER